MSGDKAKPMDVDGTTESPEPVDGDDSDEADSVESLPKDESQRMDISFQKLDFSFDFSQSTRRSRRSTSCVDTRLRVAQADDSCATPTKERQRFFDPKQVLDLLHLADTPNCKRQQNQAQVYSERAREELLSSEATYYSRLCIVVDNFLTPMENFIRSECPEDPASVQENRPSFHPGTLGEVRHMVKHIVHPQNDKVDEGISGPNAASLGDVRQIFSNIRHIRNFAKLLLDQLNEANKKQLPLGPVFVKLAPQFRLYAEYFQSYPMAERKLVEMQKNGWFHYFLSGCENQPHCLGLLLRDYMIEPVQRLPRYNILLKEMLKHTSKDDERHDPLVLALETMQSVCSSINEIMKRNSQREEVIRVSTEWNFDFMTSTRRLLKEGELTLVQRRQQLQHTSRKRHSFLLFNDMIVYGECSPASRFNLFASKPCFKLQFQVPLDDCTLLGPDRVLLAIGKTAASHGLVKTRGSETRNLPAAAAFEQVLPTKYPMGPEDDTTHHSFMIEIVGTGQQGTLVLEADSIKMKEAWVHALITAFEYSKSRGTRFSQVFETETARVCDPAKTLKEKDTASSSRSSSPHHHKTPRSRESSGCRRSNELR